LSGNNIKFHSGSINYSDRCRLLKQKGVVIWMTGLSGAGKSTIAVELEKELFKRGRLAYRLDGDNIRHHLNQDLKFSDEDRRENIRRIAHIARLFCDAGVVTLVSCISPCQVMRQFARESIGKTRFIEIFVKASIETCKNRDPKNLYKKVARGEIKQFTGVDHNYVPPKTPEIILDTEKLMPAEASDKVLSYLIQINAI
jgi:adenylyl-sulfate kinase